MSSGVLAPLVDAAVDALVAALEERLAGARAFECD